MKSTKKLIPAVKVKGKVYTGKNHVQAIKKAKKAGEKVNISDKQKIGKFKEGNKLLTREQTKKKYGISHSHQL